MLNFVPLHLTPIDRQPSLLPWVQYWTGQEDLHPLWPEGWYKEGQSHIGMTSPDNSLRLVEQPDTWFLWDLQPSAAEAALEALNESRIKQMHLSHVVLCPRIFTHQWRKRLQKLADLTFELPLGKHPFWPHTEHEPLIIGAILRFSLKSPWQVKQSPCILGLVRELQALWESADGDPGPLLCKFCQLPRLLDGVLCCLVQSLLHTTHWCCIFSLPALR